MARPLDMKVSFTDETVEKIDSLKTEIQLREDVDLVMRIMAHRYAIDEWRKVEWGPMPVMQDVNAARELLLNIKQTIEEIAGRVE